MRIVQLIVRSALVLTGCSRQHLEALRSPHVLIYYAEVFDDGRDDPATAVTKVLFNELDQASGVNPGREAGGRPHPLPITRATARSR
jgi:hypothetical protein